MSMPPDLCIEPHAPAIVGNEEKSRRRDLLGFLTPQERATLGRPSLLHTLLTFGHIWLALVLAFVAIPFLESGPWTVRIAASILLIVFIGTRQNALAVQIHEAAHYLLMRSRKGNDRFCNLGAAYWVLNDVESYRRVHHRHHIHLHEAHDPDLELYRVPPGRRWLACARMLLESLFGLGSLQRILQYLRSERAASQGRWSPPRFGHLGLKLLAQGVLLAGFMATFGRVAGLTNYFLFWVVPLFSIMPTIIRLRTVAEHFAPAQGGHRSSRFVSRTTASNLFEAYFIGAEMQFHFEHHLIPGIPHHQLARLHRLLVERGYFEWHVDDRGQCLSGGYARFWWRLLRGKVGTETTP